MYLDPGSGSLLVQIIIGAILGVGVAVRVFWSKIMTLIGGQEKKPPNETENE